MFGNGYVNIGYIPLGTVGEFTLPVFNDDQIRAVKDLYANNNNKPLIFRLEGLGDADITEGAGAPVVPYGAWQMSYVVKDDGGDYLIVVMMFDGVASGTECPIVVQKASEN